jgi:Fur family transcriptional regulator, peroxide stress response regulator
MNLSPNRIDDLVARLRRQGYRMTPQRMAVLDILVTSDGHPGVEQVYATVRQSFPMTSLATVYKTVALMKEMGELMEISFGEGGNRYDGNNPKPHPHLICTGCKKIIDTEIVDLDELSRRLAEKSGFLIESPRLDFFGICPECQVND